MIFFDSTPGGALVNALNTAAESDQNAHSQQAPVSSESESWKSPLEGLLSQFRKLLTSMEIKVTRTP